MTTTDPDEQPACHKRISPAPKTGLLFVLALCCSSIVATAQAIDSISFHLYTDSLKKGTHNYINVDGLLPRGRWTPLTDKEIRFSASHGTFDRNDLVLPADFAGEKVTVRAVLKSNPHVHREITIWVKKLPDPEFLPTKEDVMRRKPGRTRKKNQ